MKARLIAKLALIPTLALGALLIAGGAPAQPMEHHRDPTAGMHPGNVMEVRRDARADECPAGGLVVLTGVDLDRDGKLVGTEVQFEEEHCVDEVAPDSATVARLSLR